MATRRTPLGPVAAVDVIRLDAAREMIGGGEQSAVIDLPLGPELGQCCGGRVALALEAADSEMLMRLEAAEADEAENWPAVLIFGAGHVGRALAVALSPLPLGVSVTDTRPGAATGLPSSIGTINSALPEAQVRDAPAASAFVIVTHSHGLDFTIAEAALARCLCCSMSSENFAVSTLRLRSWAMSCVKSSGKPYVS